MYKNFIIKSEFLPFENNNRLTKFTICMYGDNMQDLHKKKHIHYSSAICLNIFGVHMPNGAVFDMQEHTFITDNFKSGFELALQHIDDFVKNREQLHHEYFYYYFLSLGNVHCTNHFHIPYEIRQSASKLKKFMDIGFAYNWFKTHPNDEHNIEVTDDFMQQFCHEVALCNADISHYENNVFDAAKNRCGIYKNLTVYKGVLLKKKYNTYTVIDHNGNIMHVFPNLETALQAIDKTSIPVILPDYLIAFYTYHIANTKLDNINKFSLKSLEAFNVYDNIYMCIKECDSKDYIENYIQIIKGETHYELNEKFINLYAQYINNYTRSIHELF